MSAVGLSCFTVCVSVNLGIFGDNSSHAPLFASELRVVIRELDVAFWSSNG